MFLRLFHKIWLRSIKYGPFSLVTVNKSNAQKRKEKISSFSNAKRNIVYVTGETEDFSPDDVRQHIHNDIEQNNLKLIDLLVYSETFFAPED